MKNKKNIFGLLIIILLLIIFVAGLLVNKNNKNDSLMLIDKTQTMEISCSDALQDFYEDSKYVYYWSCIKDDYMIVKYKNGDEKLISEALKEGIITIKDLDNFNIRYYKEPKQQ